MRKYTARWLFLLLFGMCVIHRIATVYYLIPFKTFGCQTLIVLKNEENERGKKCACITRMCLRVCFSIFNSFFWLKQAY